MDQSVNWTEQQDYALTLQKNKINNNNNPSEAAHLVSLLQEDVETFPLVRLGALVQSVNPLKQDT